MTTAPSPFDLTGALPTGTTVLQASAGTGKTFTIAGLVARYVAEGAARMDELLVVSFSRESTRELRGRVRERLVSARDGLAAPPPDDLLLQHLSDCPPDERARRHRRLRDALASFDAATVTTTHGFCQQVLLALGTAGDHDVDAVLVEDVSDLVGEVADDLYLRKWGAPGTPPPELKVEEFRALAREVAVSDPSSRLVPDPSGAPGLPGLRARIACGVRAEAERRRRRQHLLGYDDMLLRVQATLLDPVSGPAAAARLRARYRHVLVDEFQDTDPVQWSILHTAFHGVRTLVLIGDPKQAIYAFRGADVHAYLQATEVADAESTLPDNWRSDAELLRGLDAVFRGAALGDPRIRVFPVRAAHRGRLLSAPEAVRLRVLRRDDLNLTQQGLATVGPARDAVAADVAAEVTALLGAGTTIRPRDGGEEPLGPGHLAVLVRTNKQAALVQGVLQQAGVPVVLTGRSDVFATPAALDWQLLLEALEQPHRLTRVRRLALGAFVGRTAEQLADEDSEDLALRLRVWARVLEERGVAALFEAVCLGEAVQPRVLAHPGGERLLTDLRHVAEALHEAALEGSLGLTALLGWLRRRRSDVGAEGAQERSRRLESDADAVQVITVHTSKGLEFPVVLVPFGWDRWAPDAPSTAVFHDEDDERVRDVGGRGSPDWGAHVQAHRQDEVDDELRLTYVALTRAQGQLVLWWAGSSNTPTAPLHRLLVHDDPDGVPPATVRVPSDDDAIAVFRQRAAASDGGLQVEVVAPSRTAIGYAPPAGTTAALGKAHFGRTVDTRWRRTSYTALTADSHADGPRLGSEAEIAGKDDETDAVNDLAPPAASPGEPSLWDTLPGGTWFGTLVHSVLEQAADGTELAEQVAAAASRWSPDLDVPLLTAALVAALTTSLGPLADGLSLRDVGARDRLPELEFELPLAGGDEPRGAEVLLTQLVPLWREHAPTGLLSGYPDALAQLQPAPLRGYLTGSIDAVLRIGGRYLVVDYKTNRLGVRGRPLTTADYGSDALEQAMVDAHYPLQALLYDVALHRYLRWRLPDYDPQVHLGGALYLFLRGMTGPAGTSGVFAWRPPAGLVTATSNLLAGT